METWCDRKEVNNELQFQLHCNYTNNNVKPIKISSVFPPFAVYIPISLHVFAFLLTAEQDIALIHNAVFFSLHVCACFVRTGTFRR
jgi:hypothetical protein